jgi:hypothetical protein
MSTVAFNSAYFFEIAVILNAVLAVCGKYRAVIFAICGYLAMQITLSR